MYITHFNKKAVNNIHQNHILSSPFCFFLEIFRVITCGRIIVLACNQVLSLYSLLLTVTKCHHYEVYY